MTPIQSAPPLIIYVDSHRFEPSGSTMSGGQIKALVSKDLQYQLFLEASGTEPDRPIADGLSVRLTDGMRFYTVPPAVFGS
jgi:hypothetical protein